MQPSPSPSPIWTPPNTVVFPSPAVVPYLTALPAPQDWGAKGDGVTDDRLSFFAMFAAAEAEGFGRVRIPATRSRYRLRQAFQPCNDIHIDADEAAKIWCDGTLPGSNWPNNACVIMGGMTSPLIETLPKYNVAAVTGFEGKTIFLANTADAVHFAVGDVIDLSTATVYTIGSYTVPTKSQMNVVTAVNTSTGAISLRHPVDGAYGAAKLRNLSTDTVMLDNNGLPTLFKISARRDVHFSGGGWDGKSGLFTDGGFIDCSFHVNQISGQFGPGYGNMMCNSTMSVRVSQTSHHGNEVGQNSKNFSVKIGHMTFVDEAVPFVHKWATAFGEGSTGCSYEVESMDLGNLTFLNAFTLYNVASNRMRIGKVTGGLVTDALVLLGTLAYAGTYNDCEENDLHIGYSDVPCFRYLAMGNNVHNNRIFMVARGATSGGGSISVSGNDNHISGYFETGNPAIGGTGNQINAEFGAQVGSGAFSWMFKNDVRAITPASKAMRAIGFRQNGTTYNSVTPFSKTVTIPAGTLTGDDTMEIDMQARLSGSVGAKTVTISFAGTVIYTGTIAAGVTDYMLKGAITMRGTATVAFAGMEAIGATATPKYGVKGGLNLITTAYDLVVSITVAGAGDGFDLYRLWVDPIRFQADGRLA